MNSGRKGQRLREIIRVFSKHGLKRNLDNPAKLRLAFEELGPTFVKLGQILSTRPDLLPAPFLEELAGLQDDVKPVAFDTVAQVIEDSLNKQLDDVFSDFDAVPVASASISQVHRAVLANGPTVVVKVQRPGIRETMETDIALLRHVAKLSKQSSSMLGFGKGKSLTVMDPEKMLDELWKAAQEELDFFNEARNIKRFMNYNNDVDYVMVPKVFDEYTTSRVIVMEYVSGIKLIDKEELRLMGYELDSIGRKLTSHFIKQVLKDGFFHADPHPGNIIIHQRKIGFIDFGMMGSLDTASRRFFNMLMLGVAQGDIDRITQAIIGIGVGDEKINYAKLSADVERIYYGYADISISEINLSKLIREMFAVCRTNNISVPREMTMLLRAFLTLEGVVAGICPDMNVMEIAVFYAQEHMVSQENLIDELRRLIYGIHKSLRAAIEFFPKSVECLNSALAGQFKVSVHSGSLDKILLELHKMVNRMVMGIMLSALVVASSLVVNARTGPMVAGVSVLGLIGYIGAAIASLWVL